MGKQNKTLWSRRVGDVFTFPLADGTLAYGHVTPQRGLFAFFAIRTRREISLDDLRSLPEIRLDTFAEIFDHTWPVIGNIPYSRFEIQPFRIAHSLVEFIVAADGFLDSGFPIPGRVLTAREVESIPSLGLVGVDVLRRLLDRKLPPVTDA